jgi:hypothetical protein
VRRGGGLAVRSSISGDSGDGFLADDQSIANLWQRLKNEGRRIRSAAERTNLGDRPGDRIVTNDPTLPAGIDQGFPANRRTSCVHEHDQGHHGLGLDLDLAVAIEGAACRGRDPQAAQAEVCLSGKIRT